MAGPVTVEMPLGPLLTGGSLTANVIDPTGNAPTNVIHTTDPWRVDLDWSVSGPIVPFLSGDWRVEVALERMGPGTEILRTEPSIAFGSGTFTGTTVSYTHQVQFAPGSPALGGNPDASYRVVVMLTFFKGGIPGPFATVLDLGIIQIYA